MHPALETLTISIRTEPKQHRTPSNKQQQRTTMSLTRFNPWLTDDFFFPSEQFFEVTRTTMYDHHVISDDKQFCVSVDLPGVKKDYITVKVENGATNIRGTRFFRNGSTMSRNRTFKSFGVDFSRSSRPTSRMESWSSRLPRRLVLSRSASP